MSTTMTPPWHPLRSKRAGGVFLAPLATIDDLRLLYSFETTSSFAPRWRLEGHAPPFDEWLGIVTAPNILAQYLVRVGPSPEAWEPHGVIYAYDANLRDGYTHLAAAAFDEDERRGEAWPSRMTVAAAMFVQHLFCTHPLRKVYLHVADYNRGPFVDAGVEGGFMEREGLLRAHRFLDGEWHDLHICAIFRDRWLGDKFIQQQFEEGRERSRQEALQRQAERLGDAVLASVGPR